MTPQGLGSNPFPGLRPFEPEEWQLFFGRDKEVSDLLGKLRRRRFVAVVGSSGCGKSSLVRSGLLPALRDGRGGDEAGAVRIALLRPGGDPIGNLAKALTAPGVLDPVPGLEDTNRVLIETTLRRGTLGLVDAVRHAPANARDQAIVVVDQFEELFRLRQATRAAANTADEAVAFAKLLLEAAAQEQTAIYVILTMRSDFIGDCLNYPGLPEAINEGQYLVPRITREGLRQAITGPVDVARGKIASRLVIRLLNDMGDSLERLPLLAHVLMRAWDYWSQHRKGDEAMDLEHYEAVGTIQRALEKHAEEAFAEAHEAGLGELAARVFQALTDNVSDSRGVRRPASVQQLSEICAADAGRVVRVIEIFRAPGRTFLTPATGELTAETVIDLTHESLLRTWGRLIAWASEEKTSAEMYVRVARAARWHEEGSEALWRDPQLEVGLLWRRRTQPNRAWAERYHEGFDRAMRFLSASERERDLQRAAEEAERRRQLRRAWKVVGVLAALLIVVLAVGFYAWMQRERAEQNLGLAKNAVDEMLASAGRQPARVTAEVPEFEEFRRTLLEKARDFYAQFSEEQPSRAEFRKEAALSHFRLGDIHRLLAQPAEAAQQYRRAIDEFASLAQEAPGDHEYRLLLARSYQWLGETLRNANSPSGAAEAFDRAIELQTKLRRERPDDYEVRLELARSYYNRGIVRGDAKDYSEAIRLLTALVGEKGDAAQKQDLAKTYNNFAELRRVRRTAEPEQAEELPGSPEELYERAIHIHEQLIAAAPRNREYKEELAKFYKNSAILSLEQGQLGKASERSRQALRLLEELAAPLPSLTVELGEAHNVRGRVLESQGGGGAASEYQESIRLFESLTSPAPVAAPPEWNQKYGDALFNLGALQYANQEYAAAAANIRHAAEKHRAADALLHLGYDYLYLARVLLTAGHRSEAREALKNFSALLEQIAEPNRGRLARSYDELSAELDRNRKRN